MRIRFINANQANMALQDELLAKLDELMQSKDTVLAIAIQEGRKSEIQEQLTALCIKYNFNPPQIHFMRTITKVSEIFNTSGLLTAILSPKGISYTPLQCNVVRSGSRPTQRSNKGGLITKGTLTNTTGTYALNLCNIHFESNKASERLLDLYNIHLAYAEERFETFDAVRFSLTRTIMGDFNTRDIHTAKAKIAGLTRHRLAIGSTEPMLALALPVDLLGCPPITLPAEPTYNKGEGLDKKRDHVYMHGVLDFQLSNATDSTATTPGTCIAPDLTRGYDHSIVISDIANLRLLAPTDSEVRTEVKAILACVAPDNTHVQKQLDKLNMSTAEGKFACTDIYHQFMCKEGIVSDTLQQLIHQCQKFESTLVRSSSPVTTPTSPAMFARAASNATADKTNNSTPAKSDTALIDNTTPP